MKHIKKIIVLQLHMYQLTCIHVLLLFVQNEEYKTHCYYLLNKLINDFNVVFMNVKMNENGYPFNIDSIGQ